MASKKRVHVFVSGIVQGVFFRDSTRRQALGLGVTGWVQNLADGRVEAVFEGEADAVDDLIKWSHQGPSGALVTQVDVLQEPYSGEFLDFVIRRAY